MMRITFSKVFKKQRKKMSERLRRRADERLRLFSREPHHPLLNLHPLSGNRAGQWSINVTGDWRAISVYVDGGVIVFIDLDTHSNLYG